MVEQETEKKTYRVTWTEVSNHAVDLTAQELADLLCCEVDEIDDDNLDELTGDLADDLANLDDDGFQGLTREYIEVEVA